MFAEKLKGFMKRKRKCHNCVNWGYDDGFRKFTDCYETNKKTLAEHCCEKHEYMEDYSKTEAIKAKAVDNNRHIDWGIVERFYNE